MVKDVYYGKTLRKSFARHEEILDMPNLLEVQKNSYQWFLDTGLREVFKDVASITDYAGNLELSFIDYSMDEPPKYSVEECKARDATYAAPIKVRVRLRNKETEEIKEQEIFMGDFPLMTKAAPSSSTAPSASSSPRSSAPPASITPTPRTRPAASPTPPPSSPTGAPGWSMRPT
jgi:DNA-directed RNA polymerase beta subunit